MLTVVYIGRKTDKLIDNNVNCLSQNHLQVVDIFLAVTSLTFQPADLVICKSIGFLYTKINLRIKRESLGDDGAYFY